MEEVIDVSFVIYSLTIAGLSEFIQVCYQPEMALRWYYKPLKILYLKSRHKWIKALTKPFGICGYCQNFWLTILLYPLYFKLTPWIILSVGGSYFFLEIIRFLKKE